MRNKPLHLPVLVLLFLGATAAAATTEVKKEQERISGRIPSGTTTDRYGEMECLTVPNSVFESAVLSTMAGISKTLSMVSGFGSYFGDFRVSNAINDCLDLLDLSNDELSRTLSASQTGKSNGTGRTAVDLKTWLSAALFNQDTCIDGFDGTSGFFKQIVIEGLNQVSSLVREVLYMVHDVPGPPASSRGGNAGTGGSGGGGRRLMSDGKESFPYWISSKDRKLLQTTYNCGA